jgi:hypothetical protein
MDSSQIFIDFMRRVIAETYLFAEFSGEIRECHDDLSALLHQSLTLLVGNTAHLAKPPFEIGISHVKLAQDIEERCSRRRVDHQDPRAPKTKPCCLLNILFF